MVPQGTGVLSWALHRAPSALPAHLSLSAGRNLRALGMAEPFSKDPAGYASGQHLNVQPFLYAE